MSEQERSSPDAPRSHSEAKSPQSGEVRASEQVAESTDQERGTASEQRRSGRGRRILKWAAFIVGLMFFLAVLREAMDPFGDKPYIEISHGDHVHYVPEDRDPNVSIGRFPTTEPAADERITPDGRVVKQE